MSRGFPAVSPLSAAYVMVRWIAREGREPRKGECSPKNGLLSYMTFYRVLPGEGFSAIVSHALELVPLSSLLSAASAAPVRLRNCLAPGCEARFPFEGPHTAFCQACRKRRREPPEGAEIPLPRRLRARVDLMDLYNPENDIDWG